MDFSTNRGIEKTKLSPGSHEQYKAEDIYNMFLINNTHRPKAW